MNYLTNYYKNLSEQLQEKVNVLQYKLRRFHQLNEDMTNTVTPVAQVSPPYHGIDPGMFDPRLAPKYEDRPVPPRTPPAGTPTEQPPSNPQDGTIWHDAGGNTWIWRNNGWRCIQSRQGIPPVGTSYNPFNGRVYPPDPGVWYDPFGNIPNFPDGGGMIPDWWDQEFGTQNPGEALRDLWERLFGQQGPRTPPPTPPNPYPWLTPDVQL